MTKIRDKKVDKAYEVYFAIYQGVTGQVGFADTYKEFSPDFFDLNIHTYSKERFGEYLQALKLG